METRPTMTPDEEAAWGAAMAFEHQMATIRALTGATKKDTDLLESSIKDLARPVLMDRPRAAKVTVTPQSARGGRHGQPMPIATARKPRHWTVPMMGWCRFCAARTPQTAKHLADQHREDIDITCDRCGGMVYRRSVAPESRR